VERKVARLITSEEDKKISHELEKFPGSAGLHLKFMIVHPALISIIAKVAL
jgi:hypothetical protein